MNRFPLIIIVVLFTFFSFEVHLSFGFQFVNVCENSKSRWTKANQLTTKWSTKALTRKQPPLLNSQQPQCRRRQGQQQPLYIAQATNNNHEEEQNNNDDCIAGNDNNSNEEDQSLLHLNRREMLLLEGSRSRNAAAATAAVAAAVAAAVTTTTATTTRTAHAISFENDPTLKENKVTNDDNENALNCLLDLPSTVPDDCIRLYVCRHGQTENNRLRLVQGARVNPPINSNGIRQAQQLGKTLGQLPEPLYPSMIVHSPLLRAKQTAQVASIEMAHCRQQQQQRPTTSTTSSSLVLPSSSSSSSSSSLLSSSSSSSSLSLSSSAVSPQLRELSSLMEVDFGPVVEGQSIADVRPKMAATYGAWSMGNIDVRPDGGGDTGREALYRVEQSFQDLITLANEETNNRCMAIVSHSSFLRLFLASFLNQPLIEVATTIRLENGSITVLDVNRDPHRTNHLGRKSHLFVPTEGSTGSIFSRNFLLSSSSLLLSSSSSLSSLLSSSSSSRKTPNDFHIDIPSGQLLRMNENRHLVL